MTRLHPRNLARREGAFELLFLIVLAAGLVLGGASRGNPLASLVIQLISLPLLGWAVWRLLERGVTRIERALVVLVGIMMIWPLVQLIPLPVGLWASLGGRAELAAELNGLMLNPASRPMSLSPDRTFGTWLDFLPFVAVLLATLSLGSGARNRAIWLIVGAAVISLVLGVMQQIGGPESVLRFHSLNTTHSPVGLFANRNNFGVFLACVLPLTVYLALRPGLVSGVIGKLALGGVGVALLGGVALSGSRAALALLALSVILSGILAVRGLMARLPRQGKPVRVGPLRLAPRTALFAGAGLISIALIAAVALGTIALGTQWQAVNRMMVADDTVRGQLVTRSVELGTQYLPFGAGGGAFERVYAAVEPVEELSEGYPNQVHNDYVEVFLEFGLIGALVLMAGLIVVGLAAANGWERSRRGISMAAFASIPVLVLLAHSVVEFPLRTFALSMVFAFLVGLITAPQSNIPERDSV